MSCSGDLPSCADTRPCHDEVMYLRLNKRRKDGKTHTYWDLVESVRTAKGPRQKSVAYLGELTPSQRNGWADLQARLHDPAIRLLRQASLFEEPTSDDTVPDTVEVRLDGVRTENVRAFGDVWMALSAWRALDLERVLLEIIPEGREKISWTHIIAILVIGRILSPGSELHTAETWYPGTALVELFGLSPDQIYPQKLYRALDQVLPHKASLERHLKAKLGELFELDYELVLYDITSTYFEGEAAANKSAQRGYSRDQRSDCKQVCIGLLVSKDGMPFGYEIFPGNKNDSKTVEEIVNVMEARHGRAQRIWVMDRGMVSEKNIAFLKKREGARYIVGTPKSALKKFEKELLSKEWTTVRDGLEVQLCAGPDSSEVFILCRSRDRRAKEEAMHDRFRERIEEALKKMASGLASPRCKKAKMDRLDIGKRLGRVLGRNWRAAGLFDIRVEEALERRSGWKISWTEKKEWQEWARLSEGSYLLRTNITNMQADELWKTYIQLTDVEAAFRTIKTGLSLRPIWHQTQERVEAHILVAFLAYTAWKTIQKWSERAGLGSSVTTLLERMREIQTTDVILPTTSGREIRLSCVSTPGQPLRVLLQRLGLNVPKRLNAPRWIPNQSVKM